MSSVTINFNKYILILRVGVPKGCENWMLQLGLNNIIHVTKSISGTKHELKNYRNIIFMGQNDIINNINNLLKTS